MMIIGFLLINCSQKEKKKKNKERKERKKEKKKKTEPYLLVFFTCYTYYDIELKQVDKITKLFLNIY